MLASGAPASVGATVVDSTGGSVVGSGSVVVLAGSLVELTGASVELSGGAWVVEVSDGVLSGDVTSVETLEGSLPVAASELLAGSELASSVLSLAGSVVLVPCPLPLPVVTVAVVAGEDVVVALVVVVRDVELAVVVVPPLVSASVTDASASCARAASQALSSFVQPAADAAAAVRSRTVAGVLQPGLRPYLACRDSLEFVIVSRYSG